MASELPDALERLSLNESLTANSSASSLSKYFGQPENSDIFDTIVKPKNEEPKVDFFKNKNTQAHEDKNAAKGNSPAVSFQKRDDEEPKIFSYFSQAASGNSAKDLAGSEFFDQISQQTSKTHEPIVITNQASSAQQQTGTAIRSEDSSTSGATNSHSAYVDAPETDNHGISSVNVVSSSATSTIPQAVPHVQPLSAFPVSSSSFQTVTDFHFPDKPWNRSQELASVWWIPDGGTQRLLDHISASPQKTFPEEFKPTTPALSNSVELLDPIQGLLRHFDGETAAANRQSLTADLVTQDDKGIRELIQAGCWRAAVNLCGRLLTAYGQGYGKAGQMTKHTPHSLQLWLTRLALLVKCQHTEMAVTEAAPFGDLDSPDLFYQFYHELYGHSKRGSMVPFAFRLLAAELPAYANKINEAQERLCRLLAKVRQVIKNIDKLISDHQFNSQEGEDAKRLWLHRETRVFHSLINCALLRKDYHNAVRSLLEQLQKAKSPVLFSILGRVYLQLGDVSRAQRAFNSATELRNTTEPRDIVNTLSDAAMVAVAQNAFAEAYSYYQQALAYDPDNPSLVNNMAVCQLYMGQMQESMMLLEENLGTKPDLMLHNPTVLNVCTLYEMESSLTTQRKLGMLRLASQWRSDNLNSLHFKLQS